MKNKKTGWRLFFEGLAELTQGLACAAMSFVFIVLLIDKSIDMDVPVWLVVGAGVMFIWMIHDLFLEAHRK